MDITIINLNQHLNKKYALSFGSASPF